MPLCIDFISLSNIEELMVISMIMMSSSSSCLNMLQCSSFLSMLGPSFVTNRNISTLGNIIFRSGINGHIHDNDVLIIFMLEHAPMLILLVHARSFICHQQKYIDVR